MTKIAIYLNFPGTCEKAFEYYQEVFGVKITGEPTRFKDINPKAPEAEKEMIVHTQIRLYDQISLMGSDIPESSDHTSYQDGNQMHINILPDSKEEADRLFIALSQNGDITMQMQQMFWGDYYGSCTDQFGINWMINFENSSQ